ncbi:glycine--tRNA ligase subunit beta [Oceanithermus sp.]|uniref:glycine--tRNA ligase subunit beta n=1 Tax=Oceanithermus sp. TaxID=2268145 RepID=UPI00257CA582|nr:glycine--tRNA ligase subunit beta [Oceanithermus sp.]
MNLLFEIGTEELPAAYVPRALADLERLAAERLEAARLSFEKIETYATPRRLALVVRGLPETSARVEEERRGPPERAAFKDGQPTPAATGFARKAGVEVAELTVKDGYVWARVVHEGEPAAHILPGLLAGLVRDLPAPKKMIWGAGDGPFVRPVRWLVARLDGEVLPVEVFNVAAGKTSRGHRFLAPGEVEVDAGSYRDALYRAHVVADVAQRRERVVLEAATLALSEGYEAVLPEDLVEEVTHLVEWPVAVMGSFSQRYLELPDEVLATVMIQHQRFFPVRVPGERLTNRFIGVSGHQPPDLDVVRSGYEQVLEGRIYDAYFFWTEDLKTPLAKHHQKLAGINFQRGLGTMADKADRVREAAAGLAGRLPLDENVLREAAALFKADLPTQMVYEFPELEGVMARAYAEKQGIDARVARALEDAVRPTGPDAPLPETPEGALLAALDRADTLVGFFHLGKKPSGSADPYGLRRAAAGLVRILGRTGWDLPLEDVLKAAAAAYRARGLQVAPEAVAAARAFAEERLESLLTEAGLPTLAVRAAQKAPSVYGQMLRARLIYELMQRPEFAELTRLYKRAANLASQSKSDREPDPARFETEEEARLFEALRPTRQAVAELLERGASLLPPWDPAAPLPQVDLTPLAEPLAQILALAGALDPFMDHVLVMVDDAAVRENRLALLRGVRDALGELGALELLGA